MIKGLFNKKIKEKINYTKPNLFNDLKNYWGILYNLLQKNLWEKDFENSKKVINKVNSIIFIIVSTTDRHEFQDKLEDLEKKWSKETLLAIQNIEDYVIELTDKFNKNSSLFWKDFNIIINSIQDSYFKYLWFKRKELVNSWKEYNFPFFDNLYNKAFLYDFIKLGDVNINKEDLMKIYKREEEQWKDPQLELWNYLNWIINEEFKNNSNTLNLAYISSLLYFKNKHFSYLNEFISKDSDLAGTKYMINIDNLIQNRFYPAIEFKEEKVEITLNDWTKDERIVSKSLFFISFDSIIHRFKWWKKPTLFSGLIKAYNKPNIIYDFKVFQETDFVKIAKNIELFSAFYSSINTKEEIETSDDKLWLGKWEPKKNFEEILLFAIKNKISDIYFKINQVDSKEEWLVLFRNNKKIITPYSKKFSWRKFKEMINVICDDAKIDRSLEPYKPKSKKILQEVHDIVNWEVYKDYLRLEYNNWNLYIRRLNKESRPLKLGSLGYNSSSIENIYRWTQINSNWLILVNWPTWSWKTTLLYALLEHSYSSRPEIHVMTAEDPVEKHLHLQNCEQFEASENLTYNDLLKSFLRSDPDVIMIWEVRDNSVLTTLVDASSTWHLAFSTLHTNDTVSSLDRLITLYTNWDLKLYDYARSLILPIIRWIVNVKLLNKLCPHCKLMDTSENIALLIAKKWARVDNEKHFENPDFHKRNIWGCDKCEYTWYSGEIQWIMELMDLSNKYIYDQVKAYDYQNIKSLFYEGLIYVERGEIDMLDLVKNT